MSRRRFKLLAAIAILLAAAAAGLWVRGAFVRDFWHVWYNRFDAQTLSGSDWHLSLLSENGRLRLFCSHGTYILSSPTGVPSGFGATHVLSQSRQEWFSNRVRVGPLIGTAPPGTVYHGVDIEVPPWLLMAPALMVLVGSFVRRKRPLLGLCRQCGYDIRASPDRCPECGTVQVG